MPFEFFFVSCACVPWCRPPKKAKPTGKGRTPSHKKEGNGSTTIPLSQVKQNLVTYGRTKPPTQWSSTSS